MRAAIITGAIIFAAMLWAGQKSAKEPRAIKQTSCKPTDLVGIGRCSAVVGEMCCNVR